MFQNLSPGGKWIKIIVLVQQRLQDANVDSLLLQVQERFLGLKSSVEHNTSQEFELYIQAKVGGTVTQ